MLITDSINSLILYILNYEFPDAGNDSHDANWLNAELTIKTPEMEDPHTANAYIRAEELEELSVLCDELLSGKKQEAQFIFLDGSIELAFSHIDEMWEITVLLYGGLKPPGNDEDSFDCKMILSKAQLKVFDREIHEAIGQFPPRSDIYITTSGLKKFHID